MPDEKDPTAQGASAAEPQGTNRNHQKVKERTTQRAYTLRLRGTKKDDQEWRKHLWRTHEAVNRGAQVFGDWLLTLRGEVSCGII